jgi:uncharacterized protein
MSDDRIARASAESGQVLSVVERMAYGRCVLSNRHFFVGDLIHKAKGRWLNVVTQYTLQYKPNLHFEDLKIIGYLSHSCEPNAAFYFDPPRLICIRPIESGDLVTIDYDATEEVLARNFKCACGSTQCRGVIRGYGTKV